MRLKFLGIADEVVEVAGLLGWRKASIKVASTGSIYVELTRLQGDKAEWLIVRVANHKMVHRDWLKIYSLSPYELKLSQIADVLSQEFGKAGDVMEMCDNLVFGLGANQVGVKALGVQIPPSPPFSQDI